MPPCGKFIPSNRKWENPPGFVEGETWTVPCGLEHRGGHLDCTMWTRAQRGTLGLLPCGLEHRGGHWYCTMWTRAQRGDTRTVPCGLEHRGGHLDCTMWTRAQRGFLTKSTVVNSVMLSKWPASGGQDQYNNNQTQSSPGTDRFVSLNQSSPGTDRVCHWTDHLQVQTGVSHWTNHSLLTLTDIQFQFNSIYSSVAAFRVNRLVRDELRLVWKVDEISVCPALNFTEN